MFSSASTATDADVIDRYVEKYVVRLAESECDVRRAQALRFAVFNVELDEGLIDAKLTGLDADKFDAICDHLLVVSGRSGEVVGTYRLQTGSRAAEHLGYYSEREFDFTPFECVRGELIELGRACIHRDHRNFTVLNALWRGIATYARKRESRYLIGCSSLTSQDERIGAAMYSKLNVHLAPAPFRTKPRAEFVCDLSDASLAAPKTPKLLAAYLALGAQVCAPPAIDRDFRTIDFLTLFDLDLLRLKLASAHRFAGTTSTN